MSHAKHLLDQMEDLHHHNGDESEDEENERQSEIDQLSLDEQDETSDGLQMKVIHRGVLPASVSPPAAAAASAPTPVKNHSSASLAESLVLSPDAASEALTFANLMATDSFVVPNLTVGATPSPRPSISVPTGLHNMPVLPSIPAHMAALIPSHVRMAAQHLLPHGSSGVDGGAVPPPETSKPSLTNPPHPSSQHSRSISSADLTRWPLRLYNEAILHSPPSQRVQQQKAAEAAQPNSESLSSQSSQVNHSSSADPLHMNESSEIDAQVTYSAKRQRRDSEISAEVLHLLTGKAELVHPRYVVTTAPHEVMFFKDLQHFLQDDISRSNPSTIWIDILNPHTEDLEFIKRVFYLHPLTMEDIAMDDVREKMEVYEQYLFFSLRPLVPVDQVYFEPETTEKEGPDSGYQDAMDQAGKIFILCYEGVIITLRTHCSSDWLPRVVLRLLSSSMKDVLEVDRVLYEFLDKMVDSMLAHNLAAESEVNSITEIILLLSGSEQADLLRRIGNARGHIGFLNRVLMPKRDILASLIQRRPLLISKGTTIYLRDILDHLLSMLLSIDVMRENLNTAQTNYLAKVSIEVARVSNDINQVMRRLTFTSTTIMPLTLITGFFGMNIRFPGMVNYDDSYLPLILVVTLMLLVTGILYTVFRRRPLRSNRGRNHCCV